MAHVVIPFESVDGFRFGCSPAEIEAAFGAPANEEVDGVMDEVRREYGPVTLVFVDDALREIWVPGDDVEIEGRLLSVDENFASLLDATPHIERSKYLLLPGVGVLLDRYRLMGRQARMVSVFARERLDFAEAMLNVQ